MLRSLDSRVLEIISGVFDRFHTTLFSFYVNLPTEFESDSQMVIDNYKELIRVQDQDYRTMKLMGGDGASIELAEQYETKMGELEQANRRLQDLEQEVFDWKNRFSTKEQALREKDEAYEQLEYCAGEEKKSFQQEKETLEKRVSELENEQQAMSETMEREQASHKEEMTSMMASLKKKEDAIHVMDGSVADLEAVIQELRAELQKNQTSYREHCAELEEQLAHYKQELGTTQSALQQSEKRVSVLKSDYSVVEEELESAKQELTQLTSRQRNKEEIASLRAELDRVRTNRVGS